MLVLNTSIDFEIKGMFFNQNNKELTFATYQQPYSWYIFL